jgi:hypothetical protein
VRVEETTFDLLLRKAARLTTRRETLAALIGGGLLLTGAAASEATGKAKRRKKRKRRKKARCCRWKPMSVVVDNTAGTQDVTVFPAKWSIGICCYYNDSVTIPAGQTRPFRLGGHELGTIINNKYWFSFDNPEIGRPDVSVGVNGRPWGNYGCCMERGITVMRNTPMNEGQTLPIKVHDTLFHVRRDKDTNYKEFVLILPQVL